jgi:hypothetical protein
MSHVAKIDLVIQDLDALRAACETLGLELVEGQKQYKWFGAWMQDYSSADAAYLNGIDPKDYGKCEHAIRIPGQSDAYEVGVVKNPKGAGYVLILDFYAGGRGMVDKVGGKACERLTMNYAAKVGIKAARKEGWRVKESLNDRGEIVVKCTR